MVYTVQTRYEDFVFDNGNTAMTVAELLANNSTDDIKIQITVEKDKEDKSE